MTLTGGGAVREAWRLLRMFWLRGWQGGGYWVGVAVGVVVGAVALSAGSWTAVAVAPVAFVAFGPVLIGLGREFLSEWAGEMEPYTLSWTDEGGERQSRTVRARNARDALDRIDDRPDRLPQKSTQLVRGPKPAPYTADPHRGTKGPETGGET